MLAVHGEKVAAPDGFAPPPPGLEPGILLLKYGAVRVVRTSPAAAGRTQRKGAGKSSPAKASPAPGNPINFFPSLRPPRCCGGNFLSCLIKTWWVQLESNQHLRDYEPRALPLSYRPLKKVEVRPGVAPGKAVLQTAGSTASPCAPCGLRVDKNWGVRPVLPRFLDVHSVVCWLLHYELRNLGWLMDES